MYRSFPLLPLAVSGKYSKLAEFPYSWEGDRMGVTTARPLSGPEEEVPVPDTQIFSNQLHVAILHV